LTATRLEAALDRYAPLIPPDPADWLALDEGERLVLAQDYHEQANIEILGMQLNATIHGIIENQLAEGDDRVIMANFERLLAGGLNRHEAIHAMGSVLAGVLHLAQKRPDADFDLTARYHSGLKRLRPKDWRGTAR
jgi:hypothetical protein